MVNMHARAHTEVLWHNEITLLCTNIFFQLGPSPIINSDGVILQHYSSQRKKSFLLISGLHTASTHDCCSFGFADASHRESETGSLEVASFTQVIVRVCTPLPQVSGGAFSWGTTGQQVEQPLDVLGGGYRIDHPQSLTSPVIPVTDLWKTPTMMANILQMTKSGANHFCLCMISRSDQHEIIKYS